MALSLWSQSIFSKGEISPLMYARTDIQAYFNGLKKAKNIVTFPQGAAGKRFGTNYLNEITGITNTDEIYFQSFQYLGECVYVIAIVPGAINIYLEGKLVASESGASIDYNAAEILAMDHTVLQDSFVVTTYRDTAGPVRIKRNAGTPDAIASISVVNGTMGLTTGASAGDLLPCRFSTAGTLPVTVPQIVSGQTYFALFTTNTDCEIYITAPESTDAGNRIGISSLGASSTFIPQNTWDISAITFSNVPVYDFGDTIYNDRTFTLGAKVVGPTTLTITTGVGFFSAEYIGGAYKQGSGIARITGYTSPTILSIEILKGFDVLVASGKDAVVMEPAWSATRGYPQKTSSYQNRLIFGRSDLLPNGLWLSAINDFTDFDEISAQDDDAIAYYPTSGNLSMINHIVPYRSLTIHTSNGVFSTSLNLETAITPLNFSLTLQDSTPSGSVLPVAIDNQVIVVSGNDVYSMLWDGLNNAYTSNIVSVISEQLITNPVQQAGFSDLIKAGSRYVLIVNGDGTLAIFQTLKTEEILGWSYAKTEQSYGEAYFRHVASNFDGRAWFVIEREITTVNATQSITVINETEANTVSAGGLGLVIGDVLQIYITTAGTLLTTTPQIQADVYYWALSITTSEFALYQTKEDAVADTNRFVISDIGSNCTANSVLLTTKYFIEELDFDSYVDSSDKYSNAPVSTISDVARFNGQDVAINGDGYGFTDRGHSDEVRLVAHGESVTASVIQSGFPINVEIQPLPLSISMGSNIATSNVVEPKHVRNATFMFNNTTGGEINGKPIALTTFGDVDFGTPPASRNGTFNYAVMKGWNDFKNTSFTITHSAPFDIKLIGIFYKVEV